MTGHVQFPLSKVGDRPTMKNATINKQPTAYTPKQIQKAFMSVFQ